MRYAAVLVAVLVAALAISPALAAEQKPAGAAPAAAPATQAGRKIEITVNEAGFEPREIKLKKGEPATLVFTRKTDRTCITAIDIPAEDVKKLKLPLNQPVALTITPKKAGVEAFHCSAMGMGNGKLIVED
jgi:plastocyanin domain-containing protein